MDYLSSVIKEFRRYKGLAEKALGQVPEEAWQWQYHAESNSLAMIVKHLSGNLKSRWTDFLQSDGEKDWRHRDSEFEVDGESRTMLMESWEHSWSLLFSTLDTLDTLDTRDLGRIVQIRNEAHTVTEAINRQLSHASYHVGQIVFLARMLSGPQWKTLSIPRGKSEEFNKEKFGRA